MRSRVLMLGLTMFVSVSLFGVALTAFGQTDQTAYLATEVAHDDIHFTVYRNNTALVKDTRTFDLQAGLNRVQFVGVTALMWFETLSFTAPGAPGSVHVVEQYLEQAEPPFDISREVARNVGQTITVTIKESADERVTYEGVLLSTGNMLALQLADGEIVMLPQSAVHSYQLPEVSETRRTVPMLTLLIQSAQAGEQPLTLTYMTSGLSWLNADYNLRLAADDETVNLTGWISLDNQTDVAFENAVVTLAQGNLARVQFVTVDTGFAAPTSTAPPTATPPETSGYGGGGGMATGRIAQPVDFLLPLRRPVTLPARDEVIVEFLAGAQIEAYHVYVYDASPRVFGFSGFITDPEYGLTEEKTLRNYLAFTTGDDDRALPAGNIRIYQEDDAGTSLLIGQTQLAYTPAGETVQVFLDNPADLSGERVQTDFLAPSPSAVQETIEIRLHNAGDEAVTVRVPERMTRSPNWELLGASAPYERVGDNSIEFEIDVPASGEAIITYTVLYTNPQ